MSEVHVNKENSIFKVAINLIVACLVSGLIIGVVYFITAPIAVEKNEMIKTTINEGISEGCRNF